MRAIGELEDRGPVGLFDDEPRHAIVAGAAGRVLERDGVAEAVREPVEGPWREVAVRAAGLERGAEMDGPDCATVMDEQDLAQQPVREVELAMSGVPRDRHGRPAARVASDQLQVYVPGPKR